MTFTIAPGFQQKCSDKCGDTFSIIHLSISSRWCFYRLKRIQVCPCLEK